MNVDDLSSKYSLSTKVTLNPINNNNIINAPSYGMEIEEENKNINTTIENNDLNNLKDYHERSNKARNFPIPTSDYEVKIMLRELCEPIIIFGETLADRRERLSVNVKESIMIGVEIEIPDFLKAKQLENNQNSINIEEIKNREFYTEPKDPEALIKFRVKCLEASIANSQYNIYLEKKHYTNLNRIEDSINFQKKINSLKYEYACLEYCDERSCTDCSLDITNSYIAVSGGSSTCSVYKIEKPELSETDMELDFLLNDKLVSITNLISHTSKVNCIEFNTYPLQSAMAPHIATCSDDKLIKLWTFDVNKSTQKSTTLKGHESRVNQIQFASINNYLGSVSHDKTFRIWDLPTKKCILSQEGHIDHVSCLSFQNDSALAVTGDLSGIGLIWDLRIGKKILSLEGHVKQIFSVSFNESNGYNIISGGDDNTMRLWDLRKKGQVALIPAHNKLVSSTYQSEDITLSSGYDGFVKIWNSRDFSCVQTLNCDNDRITSAIISKNREYIFATSMNRILRMWKNKVFK